MNFKNNKKNTRASVICKHCSEEVPQSMQGENFCCSGCEYVYLIIHDLGLNDFYRLKDKPLRTMKNYGWRTMDLSWVKNEFKFDGSYIRFSLEGLKCSACVWLLKKLAAQYEIKISINAISSVLSVNKISLDVENLLEFLNKVQSLGYPISSLKNKNVRSKNSSLLIRTGICVLLAINVMGLTVSFYLGLDRNTPYLAKFFEYLSMFLSTLSVVFGGSYFFKKSYQALKNKIFHFDIPISMGIFLSYFGSLYVFFSVSHTYQKTYFDSLSVFIALMLVGRLLQERWLEKNRASVVESFHFESLKVLKMNAGKQLQEFDSFKVCKNDILFLRSGDIIPVDLTLQDEEKADFDCQWITGESDVVHIKKGETISAGARYLGQKLLKTKAKSDFCHSRLYELKHYTSPLESVQSSDFSKFTKYYTLFVLSLIIVSFIAKWVFIGFESAVETAVTLAVVTCPCAIGITLPMILFMLQQRLFDLGVYVQTSNLLARISKISAVVFDKTGTLTFLNKKINIVSGNENLNREKKTLLFNAVAKSKHPVSQKIFQNLLNENLPLIDISIMEEPGNGLFFRYEKREYFLGKSRQQNNFTVFLENNNKLCRFSFNEELLSQSVEVVSVIKKDKKVYMLSGDRKAAVDKIASKLNIDKDKYAAECSPKEKLLWIKSTLKNDRVLYLGDGLNDTEAMHASYLSGASLSQSIVSSRVADFCFNPYSLIWLEKIFDYARVWKQLLIFNYSTAIIYNVLVAFYAIIGKIGPLQAAIIMPVFSIIILSFSSKVILRT